MATKRAIKKPTTKTTKSKSVLNKKGKVNTKTLVIILVAVVAVGVGAFFGIRALSNKDVIGGEMNAFIGTKTVTQYRYYMWRSTCKCTSENEYGEREPDIIKHIESDKITSSECKKMCISEFAHYTGKVTGYKKVMYTSWSTNSKVPSGYKKANRETKQISIGTTN